jgi:D-glycero-D-manno-heptose 1,7-bisphosphate phosphatase
MGVDRVVVRRAVFLDRDGVINRNIFNPQTGQYESPLTAEDFHLIDGVLDAIRSMQDAQYLLFLVSNQPNYALGKSSLQSLDEIHLRMKREFDREGISFSEFYYCLHHPQGIVPEYGLTCACRKPSPAFLHRAQRDFHLDLSHSWMIGDRPTDTQCGRAAGAKTIRVSAECPMPIVEAHADFIVPDLAGAVTCILGIRSE